ncbi:hypothetical protein BKA70DRAFT_1381108 [Coprinopsis sp. MPI-PUGE-AT-0042]|nr:hypothetical protein BKA70DRAFT_1381108 [Coprinopsis sp. MPI-PUGE-AT-0042]
MDPTPAVPALNLSSLKGQNVLITGATRGIGAACAIGLVEAGASICLAQRHGSEPNLETYNTIKALIADDEAVMPGKEIHVLVNCAGIQRPAPAVDFSEADWGEVLDVNLKHIVNFCSLLTFQGGLTMPAYADAKGALGQLSKALANEWSKDNVQVNGICPGYIKTDMNEKLLNDPTRLRQISESIPAGRWGEPRDFAGPTVFLASKAIQYVCGELLVVDGGWMGR